MTSKNIIATYQLASQADIFAGTDWYARALTFADNLGEVYNINYATIVAVIAALSPRNKWDRNMQDTENMVKVYANGGTYDDLMQLKVCTFTTGKIKAARILTEKVTDTDGLRVILKGPKLVEFFNGIMGDCSDVTIDGHAYSVWLGERVTLANVPSIGKKLRQTIKSDYIEAAQIIGLPPHIVQAITWVTWRRIHGV